MILYLLQAAFTIWMLVDAIQRRPPYYWYIVVFVPFGPFVYFFAFKLRDYDLGWLRGIFTGPERQPSLEELLERLRRTPSYANRIAYANALYDAGRYAEAVKSFEIILETRGDEPDALYGLGRCRIELGEAERAIEPLSRLIAKNRAYRDYAACLDLADAYAKAGQDDDAVDLLEGLVRTSPRVLHCLALARLLVELGRVEEAQTVLGRGIDEYESSPPSIKKRDRSEARDAAAYLKSISPRI
jgi:hypothetical protein